MQRHQNQSYSVSDTGPSIAGAARVGGPFSEPESLKEIKDINPFGASEGLEWAEELARDPSWWKPKSRKRKA